MTNPVRPLTAGEMQALRDSIESHGRILVPILVDQHGAVIDGHHRKAIADELDLDCPVEIVEVADDTERLAVAIEANIARRQLNLVERREMHEKLRAAGWSLRRIAEVTGVDHKTVANDISRTGENSPVPDRVIGRDGVERPSSRPRPAPATRDELESQLESASRGIAYLQQERQNERKAPERNTTGTWDGPTITPIAPPDRTPEQLEADEQRRQRIVATRTIDDHFGSLAAVLSPDADLITFGRNYGRLYEGDLDKAGCDRIADFLAGFRKGLDDVDA